MSQSVYFFVISFIVFILLCFNNISFAIENEILNENENKEFNIIAVADVGCSMSTRKY